MKILITGGSGFIGTHLAKKLSKNNDIYILDYSRPNFPKELYKKFFKTNLNDAKSIEEIFRNDFDLVVHLAAKSSPSDTDVKELYKINVDGTLKLFEAARKSDVRSIIFASSSSVYGSAKTPQKESDECAPNSFYGASKLACEHICAVYSKLYGMNVSIPRFFTVYGPNGRMDMAISTFIRKIYNNEEITVHGNGKIKKDFIHVSDVVSAIDNMIDKKTDSAPINIGSGKSNDLNTVIKIIEDYMGKDATISYIEKQPWDAETEADIKKAKRLLDWSPRISIKDGIRDAVESFMGNIR